MPERTCIGCRTKRPSRDLIALMRRSEGEVVAVDPRRRHGRGAWLCREQRCLEQAFRRRAFARAWASSGPVSTDPERLRVTIRALGEEV